MPYLFSPYRCPMDRKIILLADDDREDAEIFNEALAAADCNASLIHAETGAEVFSLLENKKIKPELIFLDLNMAVMNGWQCLAKLKNSKEFASIPVIMYTTSTNPRDYEIAIDLNAHGLISKPSNPKILTKVLTIVICSMHTAELQQSLKDAYLLTRE